MIKTKTTERGKAAIAAAIAGKKLTFTRFSIGDGYDFQNNPEKKTELTNEIFSIGISSLTDNGDGTVTVEGVFTSSDAAQAFYYREVGLYATVTDQGSEAEADPVLIIYGNAGDGAEYIPAWTASESGEETYIEKRISFKIVVVNTANVTAQIDSAAFATKAYVDVLAADLQAQIDALKS